MQCQTDNAIITLLGDFHGKNKPHYVLADIQAQMMTVLDMNLTISARSGIRDVGMAQMDALAVVQALTRKNFNKSMTTHADHKVWQDVYHGDWKGLALYVKFQRASEYFVISFKEL
jgi:motility quorum-sensing regulator/GCU-specific mRNA interferase toxin